MQYMNDNLLEENGIISKMWDKYRDTDMTQSENRMAKQSLLTDLQRQQAEALDNLKRHQTELEKFLSQKILKAENTDTVQNATPTASATQHNITNHQTTEDNEMPKTETNHIAAKTNHIAELTKRLHGETERKNIKRQTMEQIDYGNKMYNKINDLQKSSLNGQDLLGVKPDISFESQIINVPNIFRQTEIHGDINRDDVNFIKTNLRERWEGIVGENFPNKITVTNNGVITLFSLECEHY